MKKTLISFLFALCLAFTFMIAGCNKNQDGNNTPVTPSEASEPEKPEKPVLPEIPEIADDPQPLPAPAGEPTASLTYEKIGNAYAVTGETANAANIVIPAEHDGLPVTTIRGSAFAYSRHNGDILSVTIPDSVTAIERNAFYNRDETTNVYISADSKLTTIGNNAFSGNHSLEFIYIPSGVTEIGDSAFNNCGAIDFAVSAGNGVYRSDNGHLIETDSRTLIRGGQNADIPAWLTDIAQAAFRRSELTELCINTKRLRNGLSTVRARIPVLWKRRF